MAISSIANLLNRLNRNESVPKILINDTINLFFLTAIGILIISNHNSFRVLSDTIACVYFILIF